MSALIWAAVETEGFRTIAALIILGLLVASLGVVNIFISRSLAEASKAIQKLHLQQATIVGMLIKAGFRPPKRGKDWFDDAHATKVKGELDLTEWDWRKPE